jgi:BolA protein
MNEDPMTVAERIRAKLTAAFAPSALELIDESDRHRGHAGARPGGETHFRLAIVSEAFAGLSPVERHRKVMAALRDEFADRLHALTISARAPGEAQG